VKLLFVVGKRLRSAAAPREEVEKQLGNGWCDSSFGKRAFSRLVRDAEPYKYRDGKPVPYGVWGFLLTTNH
jgi:hypothetical protein